MFDRQIKVKLLKFFKNADMFTIHNMVKMNYPMIIVLINLIINDLI